MLHVTPECVRPSVIGDIHEKIGAHVPVFSAQAEKNTLVADESAEVTVGNVEEHRFFTRHETRAAEAFSYSLDERKPFLIGKPFAERNKVYFRVRLHDFAEPANHHGV